MRMIPTNRLFSRREPTRDAKSLYIFCEGKKREYQYFNYFKGIDSRINIEVYPLKGNEDNSPTGLLQLAYNCFNGTESGSVETKVFPLSFVRFLNILVSNSLTLP